MKRFRSTHDGDYYSLQVEDFESLGHGYEVPCICCKTIHASTSYRLKPTDEVLCMACMCRQSSLFVPRGTKLEQVVREYTSKTRVTSASKSSQSKQTKVKLLLEEVAKMTQGGKIVQMAEIEVLAGSYGLTMKDFMRHRGRTPAPRAPMGSIRLDQAPKPKTEEEFLLEVGMSQVKDEGRSVEDVCEEFDLNPDALRRKLNEEYKP